jgi:hypothetical protein
MADPGVVPSLAQAGEGQGDRGWRRVHHEPLGSQAFPGQADQAEETGIARRENHNVLTLVGPKGCVVQDSGQRTGERDTVPGHVRGQDREVAPRPDDRVG